ncbi:MAG TPA: DUF2306 domain-containing protein [Nocardioides sp.]|nr:DUF2306 domain-containing protein [Nocardioides sp.]
MALVLTYTPIALTAAWSAFAGGAPDLQETIDRRLGGDRYAEGPGSLSALRDADYADHRILMLLHIVLGSVCLLLAVRQVLGAPRGHRQIGRAHLVLVTLSMVAAMVFLLSTGPGPGPGQAALRSQLWVLAVATLGTAWLAAAEAVRGRLSAHRAWMTLHIAFLLTAPALRLTWMMLAPLTAGRDMLTNIESGAVLLAVAAPAGGVTVALLRSRDDTGPQGPTATRGPVRGAVLVGVAGLGVVVGAAYAARVAEHVWFHVVPAGLLMVGCLMAGRRRPCPDRSTPALLLRAAAATPWAVLAFAAPVAVTDGWSVGMLTGLMVAPGFPFAAVLARVCLLRTEEASPHSGRCVTPVTE